MVIKYKHVSLYIFNLSIFVKFLNFQIMKLKRLKCKARIRILTHLNKINCPDRSAMCLIIIYTWHCLYPVRIFKADCTVRLRRCDRWRRPLILERLLGYFVHDSSRPPRFFVIRFDYFLMANAIAKTITRTLR